MENSTFFSPTYASFIWLPAFFLGGWHTMFTLSTSSQPAFRSSDFWDILALSFIAIFPTNYWQMGHLLKEISSRRMFISWNGFTDFQWIGWKKWQRVSQSSCIWIHCWMRLIGQADVILANSKFTARIFKSYFPSISQTPQIVYPGINISAYETRVDGSDPDIIAVTS